MTIASVSLGVGDYGAHAEPSGGERLVYAPADAAWFDSYVASCWPAARRILLANADATLTSLTKACEDAGSLAPDLFLLFLAGHATVTDVGASFLAYPEGGSAPALVGGPVLDRLLRRVSARTTVLLLDCCHAEGVLSGCSFFGALEGSDARVFLVSSRLHQRSWEDQATKSGLFTSCLRESLQPTRGRTEADLERDVFEVVRARLPIIVFQQKRGAAQEPVRGGIAAHPIMLPLVGHTGIGVEAGPLRALVKRFRSVLLAAGLAFAAGLIGMESSTYHLVLGRKGIEVRRGLHELARFIPASPLLRVDTGILSTDVEQETARGRAFLESRVAGF